MRNWRIKFIYGDILLEQLLFNLGRLGAADVTGIIDNNKQFTNFKFETNIFLDNLKRFYNKFGIYNKQKNSSHLFVSGNFNLIKLKLYLDEISNDNLIDNNSNDNNNKNSKKDYLSFFKKYKIQEVIKSRQVMLVQINKEERG